MGTAEVADDAHATQADLGWVLHLQHPGHGYATEAVQAWPKVAFADQGLSRVTASCFANNAGAWRLMERLGMCREPTRSRSPRTAPAKGSTHGLRPPRRRSWWPHDRRGRLAHHACAQARPTRRVFRRRLVASRTGKGRDRFDQSQKISHRSARTHGRLAAECRTFGSARIAADPDGRSARSVRHVHEATIGAVGPASGLKVPSDRSDTRAP